MMMGEEEERNTCAIESKGSVWVSHWFHSAAVVFVFYRLAECSNFKLLLFFFGWANLLFLCVDFFKFVSAKRS